MDAGELRRVFFAPFRMLIALPNLKWRDILILKRHYRWRVHSFLKRHYRSHDSSVVFANRVLQSFLTFVR